MYKTNYSTKKINYNFDKKNFFIYYQLVNENNKLRIINSFGDAPKTIDTDDIKYKDYGKIPLKFIEGIPSDEMLRIYLKKFKTWMCSAKINPIYSIDLSRGDIFCSEKFFFSLVKGYDKLKKITDIEYYYSESCSNNAIIYLKQNDIKVNCYSYDRKSAYPSIMNSDILIPIRPGKEYTLQKFGTIQVGYYRCTIESEHPDFNKIFITSKNNMYTHLSVIFAYENKDEFNIKIKLIKNGEPNAYLYDEKDCIELNKMTNDWYNMGIKLKNKYGKQNPYIKSIFSSAWGVLNQRLKKSISKSDIIKQNLEVGLSFDYRENEYQKISSYDKNGQTYFKIVDLNNPYRYKLRLKSFITSQARNDIANFSIKYGLKNVIRIATDCVSFSKDINNDDENYGVEDKTTGMIQFYNVNKYENLTSGYKSKNFKPDDEDDYEIID